MTPVIGWVARIQGSDLVIRLQTGPKFTIPNEGKLHLNESVRVFYDYERMSPGRILSLNQLASMSEETYAPWTEEDHPWDDHDHLGVVACM